MGVDLNALSAQYRLHLTYDRLDLGTNSWEHPIPIAICVGSFVLYVTIFLLSLVSPLPSAEGLKSLKKVGIRALDSIQQCPTLMLLHVADPQLCTGGIQRFLLRLHDLVVAVVRTHHRGPLHVPKDGGFWG